MLVDAAYVLLDEKGLEGLTIRAVLDRTGLARRAFYDNFASKDDLVLAVFDRTLYSAARLFRAEIASKGEPMEQLHWVITSIVLGRLGRSDLDSARRSRRSAALAREHMRLAEARPAELQSAISPLVRLLASVASQGMEQGSIRRTDPEALAMLIYNMVSTTAHTQLLAEEREGADMQLRTRLRDQIWDFCERAIRAD